MMYVANFGAQFLRKRCSKLFACLILRLGQKLKHHCTPPS